MTTGTPRPVPAEGEDVSPDGGVGTAAGARAGQLERLVLGGRGVEAGVDRGRRGGGEDGHRERLRVQVLTTANHLQAALELAVIAVERGVRDEQVVASLFRSQVHSATDIINTPVSCFIGRMVK